MFWSMSFRMWSPYFESGNNLNRCKKKKTVPSIQKNKRNGSFNYREVMHSRSYHHLEDSMTEGKLNKLLAFLQVKKAVKNKYQHSNAKENTVFGDDSLPDNLVHVVGNFKRIQKYIPLCTFHCFS